MNAQQSTSREPLLKTKLLAPQLRAELVHRPRLHKKMQEGAGRALTLICAPAGYGKSTLLTEWAARLRGGEESRETKICWLSLDERDNDPIRYLNYMITALEAVETNVGIEARAMLQSPAMPSFQSVATVLINELCDLTAPAYLILDDYQFITNPAIHEGMALFLERLPPHLHLTIATRSDPPLPVVRLRARGQMVELRSADLRFTADEAAQFLNEVMGLHLDSEAVAVLEERTEGWIAGLQMAALSMRDRKDVGGFIEGFSGTTRYILDYLLEEVLSSQTPEVQHFLLCTSILERLTVPLCDAVLENEGEATGAGNDYPAEAEKPLLRRSDAILEYLERANLFVVLLDENRRVYRYHHLFAALLRARLQQSQPELVARLHVRASAWLEEKGYISAAIHHLFEAQKNEQAADLIETYGPLCLAEGDPVVMQMAESLPQEVILARPKIGLYQIWLLIIHSQIGKARLILNALAQQGDGADHGSGKRWIQTFVTLALAFLAPPANKTQVVPLPDYALLDEIPNEEPILRNAADFLYGMALARRGELNRAMEVSVKSLQREKTVTGRRATPTLAPFLTRLYLMMGRLHAAAALCREFLEPSQEKRIQFIYTNGSMKIDLGEVLYEWNCLEESEQYIREGLRANEPWRNIMTDGFGLTALTRVLLAKGDFAGALEAVEKLEARMAENAHPREFDEELRTLKMRVRFASGELQQAGKWADQVTQSEDFLQHEGYYLLNLAHIRLGQGRYAEAEKLIAGKTLPATTGSRIRREVETKILLAAAAAGQDRLADAFGLVESALALAKDEGYVRIFLDTGEPARELLAAYLRSDAPGEKLYAQKIWESFTRKHPASAHDQHAGGPVESLSGRELEVLEQIALGRSNQEIARRLIVSAGTVKAHTASIYRKLDVANRTEAVARARQLGALS